jgi:hypothetical protein
MRAIALQPGYGAAHNNLGATLASRAAYEAAAACFETAAALAGGAGGAYEDARFNHARAMLCLGRFERGWDDHRFRASRPGALEHQRLPTDLSGMRLGLRGEQGIGDQIFFLRFARLVFRATRASPACSRAPGSRRFRPPRIAPWRWATCPGRWAAAITTSPTRCACRRCPSACARPWR